MRVVPTRHCAAENWTPVAYKEDAPVALMTGWHGRLFRRGEEEIASRFHRRFTGE